MKSGSLPKGFRHRVCPVCGPGKPSVVFAASNYDAAKVNAFSFASRKLPELMHHQLLRCLECDVLYVDPAPVLKDLAKAYDEAAFDSGEEAGLAAQTYARYLKDLALPDKVGALDIGTGDGAFLNCLLKAGFTKVLGVEPSRAPIAAADPAIRRLIRHGLFKASNYKPSSLSLVTCFQTMEHLDAPDAVGKAAFRLLKSGGAFYTVCHSHRSFSARLLGRRSPIFDIEHLQLFSPQSLRRLLEKQGYSGVKVFYISNRYPLHYWIKVFPLPLGLKKALMSAVKVTPLGSIPIPLRAGNLLGVGFKP